MYVYEFNILFRYKINYSMRYYSSFALFMRDLYSNLLNAGICIYFIMHTAYAYINQRNSKCI